MNDSAGGDAEQIRKHWDEIKEQLDNRRPSRLQPNTPHFIDYAWSTFDCKRVIEQLLAQDELYPGHKAIIFKALCSYVICPDRNILRKHCTIKEGLKILHRDERLGRKMFADQPLLGDIVGRIAITHRDFFDDFYYPIGGPDQLITSTEKRLKSTLAARSKDAPLIAAMMEIFDYHSKNLSDRSRFYAASKNKTSKLIRLIYRERGSPYATNPDNVWGKWNKSARTAALIYAAHTITVRGGHTLLEAMRHNKASYSQDGKHLRLWISRARYAADVILAGLDEASSTTASDVNGAHLPELVMEATPAPYFTESEQTEIEGLFDKEKILSNRRKVEQRSVLVRRR